MKKILACLVFSITALTASATTYSDHINSGTSLYPGDVLQSINQVFKLTQQTDGNLVLYKDGVAIWATFKNGQFSKLQEDANFVQYNGSVAVWNSNTWLPAGTWDSHYALRLLDTGELIVHGPLVRPTPYQKTIIPVGVTLGGNNPPCTPQPYPVCVFPGSASQYNSTVFACSQSEAATYASQHGWNFGSCH